MNAAQLQSELEKKPNNIRVRILLAKHHFASKNFSQIIVLLNAYTDQLNDEGFRLLAFSYDQQKDHANEVRILRLASEKDEENYEWKMLLGQAYLKQANATKEPERNAQLVTSGIQQLRAVLRLQTKYKPAFDLLLKTLLAQKAHNEARELIMEGIDKFGRRPELFHELCRLDAKDGYLVQAVSNCSESIKISPTYPDHYVFLVQALHDQKEDIRAERQIVSAAKRFPNSEFVQWAAGEFFRRKKNYPVSSRYFQAAVKADGKSARAHYGLAQTLMEQPKMEAQAFEHFVFACKNDHTTIETFLSAGSRLKHAGNMELGNKFTRAASTCRP